MKKYCTITLVLNFTLFSLFFVGCSYIKILSPSDDQIYITTPYDLEAVHTGCGSVDPETFSAWLDKGTEEELEITSSFTYSSGWTSPDFELPLGSHTLWVGADLRKPNRCISDGADELRFLVSQSTCIKGQVFEQNPSGTIPIPAATIQIYRTGTTTLVAEGVSDEEGNYCIPRVPLGMFVDIQANAWRNNPCDGREVNIDLGIIPNSCPDCIIMDIIVECFPR